ncbi:MAG: dihydroxy-acid dehydratase [Bradyrhizobium sp.]|nr:dihydroxy-acid dehydratase [Bradyrhizobium sp.]
MTAGGSTNAALRLPAIAGEYATEFDAAKIFKKTPCVADLKPRGRYVAKDMGEVAGIPLLMKTLLGNGYLHGDCLTVTGRTIAETLKSAKVNPYQGVVRSADTPIAPLWDDDIIEVDAAVETLNVKLTDTALAERKTKWKPGATNHTSGALGKYAQQIGPAADGAVTHPGGAREKQCYADI